MKTQLLPKIKLLHKIVALALVLGAIFMLNTCSDGIILFEQKKDSAPPSQPANPNPPDTSVPWSPLTPATKFWKVTIDQTGGTGLTKLEYMVKNGDTLKQSDIQGVSVSDTMVADSTVYSAPGGGDFILGVTPVNDNIIIGVKWTFKVIPNDPHPLPLTDSQGNVLDYASKNITPANAPSQFINYVNSGDVAGVIASIKAGGSNININAPLPNTGISQNTPVMVLAQSGNLELVKYLVSVGAKTTQTNFAGVTPAILAANAGHLDVSQYLIDHPQ